MVDGLIESTHLPAQPARRARPADRGPRRGHGRRVLGRRGRHARAALRQLRTICPTSCSATCSTCSPVAIRARSSPSCARGSCGTASTTPSVPATGRSGWPSPAAARSPTAACSACSSPTARGSASSTRRWCTRAAPARRSSSAPRRGASRTSRSSASRSRPAPGEPGKMPFWHGDRPGRPLELGRALGRVRARDPRSSSDGEAIERLWRRTTRSIACAASTSCSTSPSRRGDRRRARRPHDRRRALPRRDRRLAGVHPQPVRHAGPRAVGDGDRAPAGSTSSTCRSRRCGATTASSSGCPRRPTNCRSRRS